MLWVYCESWINSHGGCCWYRLKIDYNTSIYNGNQLTQLWDRNLYNTTNTQKTSGMLLTDTGSVSILKWFQF